MLVFGVFCIATYGIDQAAWVFDHPWFLGADAVAIIVGLLIAMLTITAIRVILFTKCCPPYKPIPVHLEAEAEEAEEAEEAQEAEEEPEAESAKSNP